MRTQMSRQENQKYKKAGDIKNEYSTKGEDLRDGFVYFGCKKSIKVNQSNLDVESTTIVSKTLT
jgi:hypothetical protein